MEGSLIFWVIKFNTIYKKAWGRGERGGKRGKKVKFHGYKFLKNFLMCHSKKRRHIPYAIGTYVRFLLEKEVDQVTTSES